MYFTQLYIFIVHLMETQKAMVWILFSTHRLTILKAKTWIFRHFFINTWTRHFFLKIILSLMYAFWNAFLVWTYFIVYIYNNIQRVRTHVLANYSGSHPNTSKRVYFENIILDVFMIIVKTIRTWKKSDIDY